MYASELRLGNYVELLSPANPVKLPTGIIKVVTAIKYFHLDLCNIDKPIVQQEPFEVDVNDVCGIPLSEKYLKGFGFEEEINSSMVKYWKKKHFTIYHEYYLHTAVDNLEWFFLSSTEYNREVRIKYVHELQNLFKSICFEELKHNNLENEK